MITEHQLENVITYYYLDLMKKKSHSLQPPTHATRDTIAFNKMRAEICGSIYNVEKFRECLGVIHNSYFIRQVNSIPKNTICCIDKVEIPLCEAGVQLICKSDEDCVQHIVVQKKYQKMCNNYFKLRHFNELLQEKMRQWFASQPWYIPNVYTINELLKKLFSSNFCKIAYKDLELTVNALEGV